nr:hypothetical protein [Rhodococcus sp. ACS1]
MVSAGSTLDSSGSIAVTAESSAFCCRSTRYRGRGFVFVSRTATRRHINLSARQRFARIDSKVGDPEQGGERITARVRSPAICSLATMGKVWRNQFDRTFGRTQPIIA